MLCCYAKTLQAIQIGRQELAQNRQQARNSVEAPGWRCIPKSLVMCRAPMIHNPSHLCLQPGAASKTQGLVGCDSNHVFTIQCCWAHVEHSGQCRSVSFQTPSLQSFESADGRKLPKQRATVVTVAIVCVCVNLGLSMSYFFSLKYAVLRKSTQLS